MGDGIMSAICKDGRVEVGSSGPWLRISDTVFLYTNEHVVRSGKNQGVNHVITHPNREYLGEVILSSANEADTTMASANPNARRGKYSFLADWAVIKLKNALKDPIKMPGAKGMEQRLCRHVTDIIHVPTKGIAAVIGAASRGPSSGPQIGAYLCRIMGEGLPTQLSPGCWGDNQKELHCWSLSCPKNMDKNE